MLDFLKIINNENIVSQVSKPWKRSLENGVFIPDENDSQTKTFSAQCNILKCKAPNENYIMYPYDGNHNIDEICKK